MPRIRVKRTYLELPDRAAFRAPTRPAPPGACLERIDPCPVATYRALYQAVGERWHWRDQHARPDAEIQAHLDDPRVSEWGLRAPGLGSPASLGYAGWVELVARDADAVEIQYFGLVPDAIGQGLGGFLLASAVERAWAMGADRVILNTCTLDAPQALPNYQARGFREVREEWYEAEV
ncbi:MAG TPA: GNAT family N-acetyltransferase [Gemmatimonadaceae bacterium]|nr:GNAT family N-acetyltransferase [Gemmatimonadaceae bacterium]